LSAIEFDLGLLVLLSFLAANFASLDYCFFLAALGWLYSDEVVGLHLLGLINLLINPSIR
jgi:hypothetical protein